MEYKLLRLTSSKGNSMTKQSKWEEQFYKQSFCWTDDYDGSRKLHTNRDVTQEVIDFINSTVVPEVRKEERKSILAEMKRLDDISKDEEEKGFTKHCTCLGYAIWRIENPDKDSMVYASNSLKSINSKEKYE